MKVKIGNKVIGDGCRAYVIAEVGVNHNGSVGIATRLIDAAVEAGADAVKFQKRDVDNLWIDALKMGPPDAQGFGPTFKAYWNKLELDPPEYRILIDYCRAAGIEFLCSCWDKRSVDFIGDLGVHAYKVASPDVTNTPLLKHIASKGKPIILSTGMSDTDMVDRAVAVMLERGGSLKFMLMQCTSTYPSSYSELDLRGMAFLKARYSVPVGYSGHELGIHIPVAAVAMGADLIERHITLDRTMPGADQAISLEPDGFKKMVRNIRDTEAAMGHCEKRLHESERPVAEHLRKSVVAATDIKEGTEITELMLTVKGPGTGIAPSDMHTVTGKRARVNIMRDTIIKEEDLIK